jgi:ABC-type transporter Mla MlaB component
MLRISNVGSEEKLTRLRLDGTLSGPWVEELRRMCEATLAQEHPLVVDCGGLLFTDAEGAALMRSLRDRSVVLANCSPFLKLQLAEAAV